MKISEMADVDTAAITIYTINIASIPFNSVNTCAAGCVDINPRMKMTIAPLTYGRRYHMLNRVLPYRPVI